MADRQGDDLQALKRMIEACRAHALDLDMPALGYLLAKAEASLAAHKVAHKAGGIVGGATPSGPRGRIVRH